VIDDRHEHTERWKNPQRLHTRRGTVPATGRHAADCGEGRVRFLVVGRYTSQKDPGIVRRREVRVLGNEPGQLAVIAGIRPF